MTNPGTPAVDSDGIPSTEAMEHRLALVMNGGVSLAVWMGGVASEIDNARRASNGIPVRAGATAQEIAVHDLWVKATQRLKVRVTVDVIAGTSAGGLNGVLLAAAIARGASLADLKDLWLTSAQMSPDALLKPQTDGVRSLMNGDFFHNQISAALGRMTETEPEHRREVSLIVTSTALGQSSRPVMDSAGRCFSEADHRRRFRFSRHAPRPQYVKTESGYTLQDGLAVNHFANDEPLATAARASASYPAAFAPVRETSLLRDRRVWPDWPTGDDCDWLADGGILDNSPFDPVLESITHKPVSSQWQRTVCFVVPDGEESALGRDITPPASPVSDDDPDGAAETPPPWTSVVAAALGLPREASFRDDVEHLHDSIRGGRSSLDVDRFRQLTETVPVPNGLPAPPPPGELLSRAREICTAALPLYRQTCRAAAIYQVRDALVRARANGYLDPSAEVKDPLFGIPPHPWLPTAFPAVGDGLPATWEWGVDAADRAVRVMLRTISKVPGRGRLRRALTRDLQEITGMRRAASGHLTAAVGPAESLADGNIAELLDGTYTKLQLGSGLAPIVGRAATQYADLHLKDAGRARDVLAAALAVEVSNGAGSLPSEQARPIFLFDRLGLDEPPRLLKPEYDHQLQVQEALAAAPQAPRPNDILYGTRLSHFAAFADPEWRKWDWMWGRMNALAYLATLLGLTDDEVDDLTRAILAAEDQTLPDVLNGIGKVMGTGAKELIDELRAKDRIAPVLDALFEFIRSEAPTLPPVPSAVTKTGEITSDLLAREPGPIGHHFLERVALTVLREALAYPRHLLWKRIESED